MISPRAILSHLFSEVWAMSPIHLETFLNGLLLQVNGSNDYKSFFGMPEKKEKEAYTVDGNGKAHVEIKGVIMKDVPWILEFFGIDATSTKETKNNINKALDDKQVKEIVLDIDSPGGTVSGVQELADHVYNGKAVKSISTNASDTMASAAYWIGSQSDKITANASAAVGSIGVYTVIEDTSKAAEKAGVKVHVVSSHELKGVGVPGAPVTEKQLESRQQLVDGLTELFIEAVMRGRDMDKKEVKESATGEVWLASEAKKRGLIDKVGDKEEEEEEEEENEEEKKKKEEEEESKEDKEKKEEDEEDQDDKEDPEDDKEDPEDDQEEEEDEEEDEEEKKKKKKSKVSTELPVDVNKSALGMSAKEELGMSDAKKELQLENEELKQKLALAQEQAQKFKETQCNELIERAQSEGRITPPMLEVVKGVATSTSFDVDKLKTFIDALPVQTRKEPEANLPEGANEEEQTVIKSLDAETLEVMRKLQMTDEEIETWGDVDYVTFDGKAIRYDGSEKEIK